MDGKFNSIYIDESGTGNKSRTKNNLWITVGVQCDMNDHDNITNDFYLIKSKCMRLYNKEMKGTDISKNHLNPGITKEDVAKEISNLIERYKMTIIVTASNMSNHISHQSKFTPSNEKNGLQAKDIARELMLERFSMKSDDDHDTVNLLIWDLSDQEELADFSSSVSSYVNPHSKTKINESIIPHVLGGLSHEWAELQIADFVSNYAINYVADGKYEDSDAEKSKAFKKYIYPKLFSHNGKINGVGFKVIYLGFDY